MDALFQMPSLSLSTPDCPKCDGESEIYESNYSQVPCINLNRGPSDENKCVNCEEKSECKIYYSTPSAPF